eukprot:190392-Prymnesium_polylepis.1
MAAAGKCGHGCTLTVSESKLQCAAPLQAVCAERDPLANAEQRASSAWDKKRSILLEIRVPVQGKYCTGLECLQR